MPLSWNEIRDRAQVFAREWKDTKSERAESQSFWNAFFEVFGVNRKRVTIFEKQVKLSKAGARLKTGRIDAFWKGVILIEHKSAGADLGRAFAQAADYFEGLAERDLPRYVLVSDFRRFQLHDLHGGEAWTFPLKDLPRHIRRFSFIAGYRTQEIREQDPVNLEAAERMGKLHDQLKASGYTGHPLEVYLVRLLFCLFADNTGIFTRQSFREYIETRTSEDGSDLGLHLAQIFQVLDTPREKRQRALDEALFAFEYVNGKLFEEALPLASFDAAMRATLLDCAALDWSGVSPAIFGAMFQSVMDGKARRNLGAHYTSERNILKLIQPLFLDGLQAEFGKVKGNLKRLFEFHRKLRTLVFLDPACGCGNFLVIAYRELRRLELEILRAVLAMEKGQQHLNIFNLVQVNVDQFHGIEIEEFPAQIAQVAMWLVDHQMNQAISDEFGHYYARLPLTTSPHIVHGDALRMDWNDVVPRERLTCVLGNPPFVGSKFLDDAQREGAARIFAGIKDGGVLDFVAAWYVKAVPFIRGTPIRCAFVSTNSITQGEQVGALWTWLLGQGVKIHFAHRTFRWSNEAAGMAAVHCVIIGFAMTEPDERVIYDYDDPRGEPHAIATTNINPYLVDAPDVVLSRRDQPICPVPEIGIGNKPIDDGNFLFSADEKDQFLKTEPAAVRYFKRFWGADDFLYNTPRWCLWLKDCSPSELRAMPNVLARVEAVRSFRSASKSAPTRKLAATPTRFHVENFTGDPFLLIPRHTSEKRHYLPLGFMGSEDLAGDSCLVVTNASLFHFGILSSALHIAWVRYTCGRLESRYRYSKDIVYNNFPWPDAPRAKRTEAIKQAAQGVLDARARFPDSSFADLYDPVAMPPELTRAHQSLDRAVDAAYGRKAFSSDAERVVFLFELYQRYTSLLPVTAKGRGARKPHKRGA